MHYNNLPARAVNMEEMMHTNSLLHNHKIRNSIPQLAITNAVDAKVGDIGPMTVQRHNSKEIIVVVVVVE